MTRGLYGRGQINYDFASAKEEWRSICAEEPCISIYQKDWFWDAACDRPQDWQVILLKEGSQAVAAFPFVYLKRRGLWYIETPWQVAASGIWIRRKEYKSTEAELTYLTDIINKIIDHLPYYDNFHVIFNEKLWNWQPFYWRGFQAKPYYTMVIRNEAEEKIKSRLSKSRRTRINKAQRMYRVGVDDITLEAYWDYFQKSYDNRGKHIEFEKEKFFRLLYALKEHHAMQVRTVYHGDTIVSENIVFVDDHRYYHHFVTQMKDADKDATSFAVYDSICSAMNDGKDFDFEGSMIQGVCTFNLSFNPEFETHYMIYDQSGRYKIIDAVRQVFMVVKDMIRKIIKGGGKTVDYDLDAAKVKWRKLCESEPSISLYQKDWYWDAVCDHPQEWMVILVEENDQIEAAFPFAYRKRKGLWFIETPWQVASSGIWMRPRIWNSKEKELKHMTRLAETVIGLLPYYDRFQIIFNAKFWTWQPFYWQGFQAVPRYTMTIRDVDAAEVKKSFDKNRRNRVNRGEKRYVIGVDDITFEQYWDFFEMSYRDRGRIIDYERRKMERLICALQQHHALQIRSVYHEDDLVAVNIILMDEGLSYHQFGTQKQS